MNNIVRIVVLGIIILILIYAPYVGMWYGCTSIYSNPMFRTLEFCAGVFAFFIVNEIRDNNIKKNACVEGGILSLLLFAFFMVTVGLKVPVLSMLYLPVLLLVYMSASFVVVDSGKNWICRVIVFFSGISFEFFVLQIFLFNPKSYSMMLIMLLTRNRYKLLAAFTLLLVGSIIVSELYEKPIKQLVLKDKKK